MKQIDHFAPTMSPKEQNEAIAGAMGLRRSSLLDTQRNTFTGWVRGDQLVYRDLPDFTGSLGAMSLAEEHLVDDEEKRQYVNCVFDLNNGGNGALRFVGRWACVTATAAQKAEAFLRAKGLWKEGA